MDAALPSFRFHPDPVRSGSVVASPARCRVCERERGFVYTGPCHGADGLDGALCPWCIADGSAHARFGVGFHDLDMPDGVAAADLDELEFRTPGFAVWNPFSWPQCCGRLAAYVEPAGIVEIRARHRTLEGELMQQIVHELGISGGAAKAFLAALHRDEDPTVHVFACAACGTSIPRIDRA